MNLRRTVVFAWLASWIQHASGAAVDKQVDNQFVLARPFTVGDYEKIIESFETWRQPCRNVDPIVDMYLTFSRSLEDHPLIEERLGQYLSNATASGASWRQCFGTVELLSCDLTEEEDIYMATKQDERPDWVSGPNRQFERTYRALQDMDYEVMYLMESDSVPVKDYWLDLLVTDTEEHVPFSILGSVYKGDKWDSFLDQIPEALRLHINGNAIYNLTDSILNELVGQLEREQSTTGNAIPYDYRLSQIVLQAKRDVPSSIPTFPGVSAPDQSVILSHVKSAASPLSSILKETSLIGNYASTIMIPEFFDPQEVIVHGAKMFSSWEDRADSVGNLTLVISDYRGSEHFAQLVSQIERIDTTYPFDRVLLLLPGTVKDPTRDTSEAPRIPIDVFHREIGQDSSRDLCLALPSLKTNWFMMTDSNTQLRNRMTVLVSDDARVSVSYMDSVIARCSEHAFCREELLHSREILPDNDRIFTGEDTVYSTREMQAFCQESEEHNKRPSATAYMASLEKQGIADDLYVFSDRAKVGSRIPFLHRQEPTMLASFSHMRMLQTVNSTQCELLTQDECLANDDCEYNVNFASCRDRVTVPPLCFSGENIVEVQGHGMTPMSALSIGDYVRVRDGHFSRVYSFLHHHHHDPGTYLQIFTGDDTVTALEISARHLLLVNHQMMPAGNVKIGDLLVGTDQHEKVVRHIVEVQRRGMYAPATGSGEIIVSGILASNYVEILSSTAILDQHKIGHMLLSPVRFMCNINFDLCASETYTDGISNWIFPIVRASEALSQCSLGLQYIVTLLLSPFFFLLHGFDYVSIFLKSCSIWLVFSCGVAAFAAGKRMKRHHSF